MLFSHPRSRHAGTMMSICWSPSTIHIIWGFQLKKKCPHVNSTDPGQPAQMRKLAWPCALCCWNSVSNIQLLKRWPGSSQSLYEAWGRRAWTDQKGREMFHPSHQDTVETRLKECWQRHGKPWEWQKLRPRFLQRLKMLILVQNKLFVRRNTVKIEQTCKLHVLVKQLIFIYLFIYLSHC